MRLVGKVPVEPLDEERLTNIERRLVVHVSEMRHEPSRAPRRLLAVAGMAMALAVAVFVGWKLRGDGTPVVAPEPQSIAMTGGALDLGDAQITGTDFAVERTADRVVVTMKPGKIDLHVEHDPSRLFVVKAGDVEIEDVGTRFTVDWDGGANVEVEVTEGEVKVKRAGKEESIKAGGAWTVELGPITIADLGARRAATNVVSTADPQPQHDPVVTAQSGSGNASSGGNGNGHGSASRPKPHRSNAKKALAKHPYEPPDDVGTDDPKAAIAKYREKLRTMPEGEDKARVLYSIAVMEHRAKNDAAAKHTLKAILKRQGGPAYKAALWLNVRIHCLPAFDDECRIAAQKYLANFETGPAAGVAQEILKEIWRGQ